MKKKTKKRIKKILKPSIWRDLSITVLGVIIGLMITSIYDNYKLKNEHKDAIEQIWNEIRDNQKVLLEFNNQMFEKFESYNVLDSRFNKDLKVIVPKDSIEIFKRQVASVFKVNRIESYTEDSFRVGGDLEIYVGSRLLGGKLRNSVWNAFSRQQKFLSITDFETIADLEQIHTFQLEVNELTKDWKKSLLSDFTVSEKKREQFIKEWFYLIAHQRILIESYNMNLAEREKVTRNNVLQQR